MIPRAVKVATVVGMGLLIALIGMVSIRLVVPNTDVSHTCPVQDDYSDGWQPALHLWGGFGMRVIVVMRKRKLTFPYHFLLCP